MPTTQVKEYFLLKFGTEWNMLDLLENGTVYCKPLQYFKDLEDGKIRGDPYEGLIHIQNVTGDRIKDFEIIPHNNIIKPFKLHPSHFQLRTHYSDILNVYCMYSFFKDEMSNTNSVRIDGRIKEFGTHGVVFFNSQLFYDRLIKAITDLGLDHGAQHVSYFDTQKYSGNLDCFQKDNEYEWQREFRFAIKNIIHAPLFLKLGSLKDIAHIVTTDRNIPIGRAGNHQLFF
jgi:hypothetical protein